MSNIDIHIRIIEIVRILVRLLSPGADKIVLIIIDIHGKKLIRGIKSSLRQMPCFPVIIQEAIATDMISSHVIDHFCFCVDGLHLNNKTMNIRIKLRFYSLESFVII